MKRGLEIAAGAALAALAVTVALRDPEQPFAIATVVAALGIAAGAGAARLFLAAARRGRSAAARGERIRALRRGATIGAAVAILAGLRAVDGLTPLTGGLVVLAFGLGEAALSARRPGVR